MGLLRDTLSLHCLIPITREAELAKLGGPHGGMSQNVQTSLLVG
jgi:UPF0716 family protein affecting phage T7 exclusion